MYLSYELLAKVGPKGQAWSFGQPARLLTDKALSLVGTSMRPLRGVAEPYRKQDHSKDRMHNILACLWLPPLEAVAAPQTCQQFQDSLWTPISLNTTRSLTSGIA